MAVSTSTTHNNAIVGVPQVGADTDIFETHSSPRYAIGHMYERADGARFRYAHFGALAMVPGLLMAQDFSESGTAKIDDIVVAPTSATKPGDERLNPGALGSRYVQVKAGATTADQFAGGYFWTNDGTGEGYTYRIKGNTAVGTPATGQHYIELYEPLQVALDTSTDIGIYGNKYANLESATAATDAIPVGVNMAIITDSTSVYGWVMTRGVVAIKQDASAPALGDMVELSSATEGNMSDASTAVVGIMGTEALIGVCLDPGASTEYTLCKINLE